MNNNTVIEIMPVAAFPPVAVESLLPQQKQNAASKEICRQYCTISTTQFNKLNRILNPTSQTKTYGRQDSNAAGHTNKAHQLSQSTGKSTLLDVARRVVNRVMNSHQLII